MDAMRLRMGLLLMVVLVLLAGCGSNNPGPGTSTASSVPDAPQGVAATAGAGFVTVEWPQVPGATSYNIYWANEAVPVTKQSIQKMLNVVSPYRHENLPTGVTYYYVVTAVNGAGESIESATVSARMRGATYIVTYDGNDATGGTAPEWGSYEEGETVTVPGNTGSLVKIGATFGGWDLLVNDHVTTYAPGETFSMIPEDITLYARWNYSVQRTLTVYNSPNSAWMNQLGRVSDDLGKINCGEINDLCIGSYNQGTTVTLTATPLAGFTFTGWGSDDCWTFGTTNPITLTMDTGKSCSAKFEAPIGSTFTMTVTYGAWIAEVNDLRNVFPPHVLDCGPDATVEKCTAEFPRGGQEFFHASANPAAPAGNFRWQCTSDDPLKDYDIYTGAGAMLWFTKNKSCNVTWVPNP